MLNSTWPKFRGNLQNTGQSELGVLPNSISKIREVEIGKIIQEPIVGPDNKIYLLNEKGNLFILDLEGNIKHEIGLNRNLNCPTFDEKGNFYLSAIGIIQKYNPRGELIWEDRIDGVPTGVTINSEGKIYFAAYSFNWAGLYAYKSSSDRVFDIPLLKRFNLGLQGLGAGFSGPCLTHNEDIIVVFRYFDTYTWDPEEGPEGEHHYHCFCVDAKGKILWTFTSSLVYLWRPYFPIITKDDLVIANFSNQVIGFDKGTQIPNWQINYFDELETVDYSKNDSRKQRYSYNFAGYPVYNPKSDAFYSRKSDFQKVITSEPGKYPPPVELGGDVIIMANCNLTQKKKIILPKVITSDLAIDIKGRICAGTDEGIIILSPSCELIHFKNLGSKINFCIIGPNETIICSDNEKNLYICQK